MSHWFTSCQRRPNQPVGVHRNQMDIESRRIGSQVADGDLTNPMDMLRDLRVAVPASHPCQDLVYGWPHGNPTTP